MIMINLRWFKFSNLFLLGLLIIGCSKDDDENGTPESKEEQEQVIMDNAAKVVTNIKPIFEMAESAEEMGLHLDEIKAMEYVEDAWQNDGSLSVKIKDGGIITWCFFPEGGKEDFVSNIRKSSPANGTRATDFALCEKKNACIVNTVPYDVKRGLKSELATISDMLSEKGYACYPVEGESVTAYFLCKELPNYGVTILITHGGYIGGQHWIMTGTTYDATEEEHFYEKQDYADHWPGLKYFFQDWKANNVQLWPQMEIRHNDLLNKDYMINVTYLAVSETYLRNKISKSFPANSLLFTSACEALENNPSLWNVFKDKGLGCFFGYDNTVSNNTVKDALTDLMETMLNDYSTASEGFGIIKKGKVDSSTGAHLKYYPEGSNVCLMSLCPDNNHPHAIDLGIGTKWACCNVGASSPEEYGGKFAWGETSTKEEYSLDNYKYFWFEYRTDNDGKTTYHNAKWTKYNYYDGKNVLETSDDAAIVNWGNNWRTPMPIELEYLNNCSWKWIIKNGVKGYKVTGTNGNSIFLPVEFKNDFYMSNTCESPHGDWVYMLQINSNEHIIRDHISREMGFRVRPINP